MNQCQIERDRGELPQSMLFLIVAVLALAIAFPLFPLWGFGIRLVALLVIWHYRQRLLNVFQVTGRILLTVLISIAVFQAFRIAALLSTGTDWLLDRVWDIHGLQLPMLDSMLIALLDTTAVVCLSVICWNTNRGTEWQNKLSRAAIIIASLFGIWSFFSCFATLIMPSFSPRNLHFDVNWLRVWMCWVICFLVSLKIESRRQIQLVLRTVVASGGVAAAIVITQHLCGDYSYILSSPQSFESYFLRVRGNYYYHGAVNHFLLIPLFAALAIQSPARAIRWSSFGIALLIAAALYLNSTRATALSVTVGMGVYLALAWPHWRRKFHYLTFAVCAIVVFSSSINYVKPSVNQGEGTNDNSFVKSNASRLELLKLGVRQWSEFPILGYGPGGVQFSGSQNVSEDTVISSHSLFLDIFLGGGVVIGVAWLAWLAIPLLSLIRAKPKKQAYDLEKSACIAMLCGFGSSCMFFSIERADTIAVFVLMAGISLTLSKSDVKPKRAESNDFSSPSWFPIFIPLIALGVAASVSYKYSTTVSNVAGVSMAVLILLMLRYFDVFFRPRMIRYSAIGLALVVFIGSLSCAAVTSSCYMFPALEFAWQARGTDLSTDEVQRVVYTNSTALSRATRLALDLMCVSDYRVNTLKDDPQNLPHFGQIIWNPGNDHEYPQLIKHFGYSKEPPIGRVPGLDMPANWDLTYSLQMSVFFFHINNVETVSNHDGGGSVEIKRPVSAIVHNKQVTIR